MSKKTFNVETHYQSQFFRHLRVPSAPVDRINSKILQQTQRAEEKLVAKDWYVAVALVVASSFLPIVAATHVLVPYVAPVLAVGFVVAGFLVGHRSR